MRLDLHVPGNGVEASCRPHGRQFHDMADAGGNGPIDQRDLIGHLPWRCAMRNEQPIDATKRLHKRLRLIEVDRGGGDTAGQLGRIGPPGQRNDIDRIGGKEAGQRRADATCPPAMAMRGWRAVD